MTGGTPPRNAAPSSWSPDSGYTLAETLVAMFVFLAVIGAAWAMASAAGSGLSRATRLGSAAAKADLVDRSLRAATSRSAPPFWRPSPSLGSASSGLTLDYADGLRDSSIAIAFGEGRLSIAMGEETSVFTYVEAFEAAPYAAEGGKLAGVEYSYSLGGKEYFTRAPFGSWSLLGASP